MDPTLIAVAQLAISVAELEEERTAVGFTVLDAWFGDLSWWWALVAAGVVVAIVLVSRRLERPTAADADADPAPAVTAEDPATPA